MLRRADYLSAVSGGSYIASAYAVPAATATSEALAGERPYAPGSPEEALGPQPLLVPHQQRDRHGAPRGRGGGRPARQPRLLHRAAVDRRPPARLVLRLVAAEPAGVGRLHRRPVARRGVGCRAATTASGLTGLGPWALTAGRPRPRRGRAGHRRAHVPARVAAAPDAAAGGGPAGGGGRARRPRHPGAARADRVHPQRAGRAPRDGPGRRLDRASGRRATRAAPTSASSPPSAGPRRCWPSSSRSAGRCGRRRSPAAGPSPGRRRGHSGSRAGSAASPTPSSAPSIGPLALAAGALFILNGGAQSARPSTGELLLWGVMALLTLVMLWFADVTAWSLHPIYKWRIARTFAVQRVVGEDGRRKAAPVPVRAAAAHERPDARAVPRPPARAARVPRASGVRLGQRVRPGHHASGTVEPQLRVRAPRRSARPARSSCRSRRRGGAGCCTRRRPSRPPRSSAPLEMPTPHYEDGGGRAPPSATSRSRPRWPCRGRRSPRRWAR